MIRNVSSKGLDFSQLQSALSGPGGSGMSSAASSADAATASSSASAAGAGLDANSASGEGSFLDMLTKGIKDVNSSVKDSDKAATDIASGKSSNIHETMLAVTKAELGFNMLVQLRNKAIEAYQDVMRMQV
jgi:flagellar hook-basal body complex protein FliE